MERSFRKTGQRLCLLTLLSAIRSAGSEDVNGHGIRDSVTIRAGYKHRPATRKKRNSTRFI